ncbi:major facilitator superfamily domain-containing protein [Geopyxis carbonaria]|nr:major facilitator superfamily domain-containing protein [Geopyxis carbonaria]
MEKLNASDKPTSICDIPPTQDTSTTAVDSVNGLGKVEHVSEVSGASSSSTSTQDVGRSNHGSAQTAASDVNDGTKPIQPQSQPEELSKNRKSLIVAGLCICVFLAALDQTIIITAIPVIAGEFNSPSAYNWIGSSYLLASAAFLPSWGKFSDIWGRKPVLLAAAVLFMIGSILCAAAKDIGLILTGRVIQGLGAGGQLGLVNVIISDIFSMRERGIYLSYVGMTWAAASAIGPVLGGVFTGMAKWGWRFCFIINVPIGLVAIAALVIFLHLQSPKLTLVQGLKRVDWLGTLLIVAGTVLFLLGLEFGGVMRPWNSPMVLCLLVFGVVLILVFILVEWKVAKIPIMPLRLFKNRTNICCCLVGFCHGFVFIAGCYFLPFYFQAVRGDTPLLSGVYVLPYVFVLSTMSGITGLIIARTGRYQELIWGGCIVQALGFGLFIDLTRTSSWAKLTLYQVVAGLGSGPLFQAPLIALQATIDSGDVGTATSTFAFLRSLGTALAISIGLVVFQNRMAHQADLLRQKLPLKVAQMLTGGSASASIESIRTLDRQYQVVVRDAFGEGTRTMWYFFLAIAVCCIIFSVGIGRHHLSRQVNSSQPAVKRPRKKVSIQGE